MGRLLISSFFFLSLFLWGVAVVALGFYLHNPAPALENDTHKFLLDFDIQTDHLISARRPDLIIINNKKKKENLKIVDFAVPADHRIKLKE